MKNLSTTWRRGFLAVLILTMVPCLAVYAKDNGADKAPKKSEAASTSSAATVPGLPAGDFSIVVLPDPQHYASKYPKIGIAQTEWIKGNIKNLQIAFVTSVGDNVDAGFSEAQYKNSVSFMDVLNGVVPYGVACGNHDLMDGKKGITCTNFLKYYGPPKFKKFKWYGGASESGFSSYQRFSGGGHNFIAIQLTVDAPQPEIDWARKVLAANPHTPAIVTTHQFLGVDGAIAGHSFIQAPDRQTPMQIWDQLIDPFPQVFMVICGHYHGEAYTVKKNHGGQPVHILLQDYQNDENGGNGWLRIYSFHPSKNKVDVQTYSPSLKEFLKTPKSEFNFDLDFKRFAPAPGSKEEKAPKPIPAAA